MENAQWRTKTKNFLRQGGVAKLRGGQKEEGGDLDAGRKPASKTDEKPKPGELLFTALLKNVRSIQTEERFEEFTEELTKIEWDAVLVNETWRQEEEEEIVKLSSGDHWFGSGGSAGKHGVGILLRHQWKFHTGS